MRGIFIDVTDIQKIWDCHESTAWKKLRTIRDALEKHNITVSEYCQYEQITEDLFFERIKTTIVRPESTIKFSKKLRITIKQSHPYN